MDLLKNMMANRQAQGLHQQPQPLKANELPKPKVSSEKPAPGTKAMRVHIIDKKPGKKVIKEHFEAIIAQECESSSDED